MDPLLATNISTEPLHGSCSCGRNQYLIALPSDPLRVPDVLSVEVDDSAESRTYLPISYNYSYSTPT